MRYTGGVAVGRSWEDVRMDISYLLWLQGIREALPPVVEDFFVAVSALANNKALAVLPCLLFWCFDKRAGRYMLLSFSFGTLLNQLVKNTVCCLRPWMRSPLVHPSPAALPEATGYSFPSGHTQGVTSLFGALGWYHRRRLPRLFALCCAFVLVVAFSRNFLGVHTPQDVLVAMLEGAFVIWALDRLLEWVDDGTGRDLVVLLACLAFAVIYLAFVALRPYPLEYDAAGSLLFDPVDMQVDCFKSGGVFVGAMLGWFLERRTLDFEVDARKLGAKRVALRVVIGLAVAGVMLLATKLLPASLDVRISEFVEHFLVFMGGVYVAPAAFCAVERLLRPTIVKPM